MLFKFEFIRPDTYLEETGTTWREAGPRTEVCWWASSREEAESLLQGWAVHEPVFLEEIKSVPMSPRNRLWQAILDASGDDDENIVYTVGNPVHALANAISEEVPLDWAPRFLNTYRHNTSLRLMRWRYHELIENWVRNSYSQAWKSMPQGKLMHPGSEHFRACRERVLEGVRILYTSDVMYSAECDLQHFGWRVPESQEARELAEKIERDLVPTKVALLDEMLKLSRA